MAAVALALTGDLTFAASAAGDDWIDRLPSSGTDEVTIDLAQVGKVDSCAVALLVRLKRRAEVNDKRVVFTNLPQRLVLLLRFYGLDEIIGLDAP